jgi:hypothetical protein
VPTKPQRNGGYRTRNDDEKSFLKEGTGRSDESYENGLKLRKMMRATEVDGATDDKDTCFTDAWTLTAIPSFTRATAAQGPI